MIERENIIQAMINSINDQNQNRNQNQTQIQSPIDVNHRLSLRNNVRFKKTSTTNKRHKTKSRLKPKHRAITLRWKKKRNRNKKKKEEDQDLEVMSAKKSIRCPLTLCIYKHPMRSTKCDHVFEKEAIHKYIKDNQKQWSKASICPLPGCQKKIAINDLVYDHAMIKMVEKDKNNKQEANKNKEEFILELDCSDDDNDSNSKALDCFWDAVNAIETQHIASKQKATTTSKDDDDSDIEILN